MSCRLCERMQQVAGGLKALAALLLTVALALADYYDAVPLRPVLDALFGDKGASKLVVYLPIVFGTLRYVSSNQLKWQSKEPF
jgi:hypothetical protein